MATRIGIVVTFLLIAVTLAGLASLRRTEAQARVEARALKPAVVRTQPLQVENYRMVESFYGLVEPRARVNLGFQIRGRLSQLGTTRDAALRENDRVSPGQVLALLEPDRYRAAVEQAQAQMEEAKAAVASAQAMIEDAKARLDDAKLDEARVEQLRERGASNERDLERVRLTARLAQANHDAALAKFAGVAATYDATRAAINMANVNLQDATLRSPIAGIVAAVPVEVGQMVEPGQLVVSVVDMSSVKLMVGVVERRLPLLREGQSVEVVIEALRAGGGLLDDYHSDDAVRKGLVTLVPPAADAVTGLFNIEIALDNSDGRLRPGMIGRANVLVTERPAIAVPAEAVVRKVGNKVTTYFVTRGYRAGLSMGDLGEAVIELPTYIAREVTFEPVATDKGRFLLADLPAGYDELVIEGQTLLEDGQPVQVLRGDASAEEPSVFATPVPR